MNFNVAAIGYFPTDAGRQQWQPLQGMKLTDDEIINNYLIPAREFVQRGTAAQGAMAGAFSRQDVDNYEAAVDAVLDGKAVRSIRIGNTPAALLQAGFQMFR